MHIDFELLEKCRRFGTSTWSDAMDEFAIDGIVSGLSHRSGGGRIAGFALPVRARTGPLGSIPLSDFALGTMSARIEKGQVLVVEMHGAEISTMGGIGAKAIALRGAEGVIIDGACRDLDDIRNTGLWVASRYVTPRTGKRRAALVSIGREATIGGISVSDGDLVVADTTGIVVVPKGDITRVLAVAEQIQSRDDRMEEDVGRGATLDQAMNDAKSS